MIKTEKCPICGHTLTVTDHVECDSCKFQLRKAMGIDIDTYDAVQLINKNPIVIKNRNRTTGHEFAQKIHWNGETSEGATGITFLTYDSKYVNDAAYVEYQAKKRKETAGQPTEKTKEICKAMGVKPFMIRVTGSTINSAIYGDVFDGKKVIEAVKYCKSQNEIDDHTESVMMAVMYQLTINREKDRPNLTIRARVKDILNTYNNLLQDILIPLIYGEGITANIISENSDDERGLLILRLLHAWIHNFCWKRPDLVIDARDNIAANLAYLIKESE